MASVLPLLYDLAMLLPERLIFREWRAGQWTRAVGPRILEIGVGTGLNSQFYLPQTRVYAIDRSAGMLARARTRMPRTTTSVCLAVMDAQTLAFQSGAFDTAVATFVFCSGPDPVLGLREVHRVLRPGGRLVLLEHVRPPGGVGRLADLVDPLSSRIAGEHFNRETVESVRRAGFVLEECESLWDGIVELIVARAT